MSMQIFVSVAISELILGQVDDLRFGVSHEMSLQGRKRIVSKMCAKHTQPQAL